MFLYITFYHYAIPNANSNFANNGTLYIGSISDIKYFKTLKLGCYELMGVSTTYFPTRWGTLLHFRGGGNYGAMLVIGTNGILFTRHYSLDNDDWYGEWIEQSHK